MRSLGVVVEIHVFSQNAHQLSSAENNDVVEAIPSQSADHSFAVGVLPGRPVRGSYRRDATGFNFLLEVETIDLIIISYQVFGCSVVRKRLNDLLSGPSGSGRIGDIEMNNPASFMRHHNQDIEQLKIDRRHDEEVDGCKVFHMVVQECAPSL